MGGGGFCCTFVANEMSLTPNGIREPLSILHRLKSAHELKSINVY